MSGIGKSFDRVAEEDRLRGVRGWLLLPPVIVGLTIFVFLFSLVTASVWGIALGPGEWTVALAAAAVVTLLGGVAIFNVLREKRSGDAS